METESTFRKRAADALTIAAVNASEQQRLREELCDRAGSGEITGAEADAEAERLGLGRLSHIPDPSEYEPQKERLWTLPMAVAWIAYGDLGAVREQWDEYRAKCIRWYWRRYRAGPGGPERSGWFLEQRPPPSITNLALATALPGEDETPLRMSVSEAEEALWIALRTDCFRVTGINPDGQRVEITPIEWIDLKLILGRNDREELRFGFDRPGYRDVRLPSASVRGLWAVRPPKPQLTLGPLMRPEGEGYMPLSSAAQWIATKGGRIDFDPEDVEMWRPGYVELLNALASETVGVIGTSREGHKEEVAGLNFADCQIEYPHESPELSLLLSDELHLRCHAYEDDESWRDGFSDMLVNRTGVKWTRLMVLRSEVRDRWPFETDVARTGVAGRPTSMYLVTAEFDRRREAAELRDTLREEATFLTEWFRATHRDMPPPTLKTVENNLRHAYKRARSAPK